MHKYGEAIKPFNKFDAIQECEAIAYQQQERFTALGYAPFIFLVDLDDLRGRAAGCYSPETDTITIDFNHYLFDDAEWLLDIIIHEMVHMYVDRYHPEATHFHGKEFCELYFRMTGKQYDNAYIINNPVDVIGPKPKNWHLLLQLGTIRV